MIFIGNGQAAWEEKQVRALRPNAPFFNLATLPRSSLAHGHVIDMLLQHNEMAELNAKVDVEPTAYEIYKGKLYVFYDHADLSTRELWLMNPEGMVARANVNWNALSK